MFTPQMVAIKLPILKHLLIRHLALLPLWISHIFSYIIVISNLGDVLITQGFEVSKMLLKMWLLFKMDLTTLELMNVLVFSIKYRISMIFR